MGELKNMEVKDVPKKGNLLSRLTAILGPGLITAATVLGPGSITVSSKSGALMEYSILWAVVMAAIFMASFTRVSARIGCLNEESLLSIVERQYGRWVSLLMGISVFLICAGFQTGNNIGVGLAMDAVFGGGIAIWSFVFLAIALIFIWTSTDFYNMLEKVMMVMVLLMIIAFIGNLFRVTPKFGGIVRGLVPSKPEQWGLVIAISATSFSIAGAAAQAYMVQGKGWKEVDLRSSQRDATVGIIILCGLSAIIMITSAAVLAPKGIQVDSAIDMAIQLEPLLGSFAKWLFLMGLFAASFSSFVANATLGGMFLSDGLGLGRTLNDKWVKILTTVLLVGSTLIAAILKANPIQLLIVAQATTILGGPLVAIVVFLLSNNKDVMKEHTNNLATNIILVIAIIWIIYLSYNQLVSFIR